MINENDFDAVLSMDDPEFVNKFREAVGIKPGDEIEIRTPQFTRTDGIVPTIPIDAWSMLATLPRATLKAMGCCAWDEPDADGNVLMLFPGEWYPYIPKGLSIVDINGEQETFEPGITDDDISYGCLAYGVIIAAREQQV